ncbi:MAG TPA: AI-2E family transporter [Candidatus Acidoferrales bacterium]|nr:AI-2E family transporter [Candidatus Acidoferrales bacterium]
MDSRSTENSLHIPWIITAVVSIAALYYGREVLIPIVVAMLLTVLLSPVASRLERHHFGKTLSALVVWITAVIVLLFVGWLVVNQGVHVATQLPAYSATISQKIESIRGARNSGLGRAATSIRQLGQEFSNAIQSSAPAPSQNQASAGGNRKSTAVAHQEQPVPVKIVGQPNNFNLKSLGSTVSPIVLPILKIFIVFVVTAFMLLRRRDIQERLFTLAGLTRIHVTKQVFTDATNRIVRYLWLLSSVNMSFGALFGTALYFLGVPNALLWGVLAGLLRFIPYIGSTIGAAMPILLSLLIFGGWTKPLIALGVFLFLEGVIGYFVEPILYARRTGVSSLAILVAAIFWAALWGPIGLLLSMPLTVCIVTVGRYIPELEFLNILFGDKSSVATDVQLYQALSAGHIEESQRLVDDYLKERSIRELYDSVLMPVLVLAEKDRANGWPQGQRRSHLFHELKIIVEELSIHYPKEAVSEERAVEVSPDEQILPYRHPGSPQMTVSCIPVRDEGDEVACIMLTHLFKLAGYNAHEIALGTHTEMLDEINELGARIIYVSALPPFAVSSIRRLYKRIQTRCPKCRVALCLWNFVGDGDSIKNLLNVADSDLLLTTLGEATLQVQQLAEMLENQPHRAGKD